MKSFASRLFYLWALSRETRIIQCRWITPLIKALSATNFRGVHGRPHNFLQEEAKDEGKTGRLSLTWVQRVQKWTPAETSTIICPLRLVASGAVVLGLLYFRYSLKLNSNLMAGSLIYELHDSKIKCVSYTWHVGIRKLTRKTDVIAMDHHSIITFTSSMVKYFYMISLKL